jgi:hypothetical protein
MFQSYNGSIATMLFCGGHPHVPLTMGGFAPWPPVLSALEAEGFPAFWVLHLWGVNLFLDPWPRFSPSLAEKETRGLGRNGTSLILKGAGSVLLSVKF